MKGIANVNVRSVWKTFQKCLSLSSSEKKKKKGGLRILQRKGKKNGRGKIRADLSEMAMKER